VVCRESVLAVPLCPEHPPAPHVKLAHRCGNRFSTFSSLKRRIFIRLPVVACERHPPPQAVSARYVRVTTHNSSCTACGDNEKFVARNLNNHAEFQTTTTNNVCQGIVWFAQGLSHSDGCQRHCQQFTSDTDVNSPKCACFQHYTVCHKGVEFMRATLKKTRWTHQLSHSQIISRSGSNHDAPQIRFIEVDDALIINPVVAQQVRGSVEKQGRHHVGLSSRSESGREVYCYQIYNISPLNIAS
jgi:hypothetical protein